MTDATVDQAHVGAPFRAWARRAKAWLLAGEQECRPVWYVCNQTPRPIWLEYDGRVFTLAPLERRPWGSANPLSTLPVRAGW